MLRRIGLMVLILIFSVGSLWAFQNRVLFEEFTNASCPPCAGVAPVIAAFIEDNIDNITPVITHVWWPGGDPWYPNATPEAQFRVDYYGVTGVPDGFMGGSDTNPGNLNGMVADMNNYLNQNSPVEMNIIASPVPGNMINVTVIVTSGDEAVTGNKRLRVALQDVYVRYNAPNGQQDWHFGLLDMLPDANGTAFTIEANTTDTYNFQFPWQNDYETDNLCVAAWIQNDANHSVVQSAFAEHMTADYAVLASADETYHLVNPDTEVEFELGLINLGLMDDTYDIEVVSTLPAGWTYNYTTFDGEQVGNSTISLNSLQNFNSIVEINTGTVPGGSGELHFRFDSQNNDLAYSEITFFVMSSGKVLIVNGDSNAAYTEYYSEAFDRISEVKPLVTYAVWPLADYELDMSEINDTEIEMILWYWGDDGILSNDNIENLIAQLNRGVSLFISGSDAPVRLSGSDLIGMMGADYLQRYEAGTNVEGVEGDPVSDGMNFPIEGGDGANNRGVPCSLSLEGGEAYLMYSRVRRAGIRYDGGNYRTLINGFPFEAIATADARYELMLNCVDYLLTETDAPEESSNNSIPECFSLAQNYPNPFNPETEISFTLPQKAEVELVVFDMMGREVASLAKGSYPAGVHFTSWNAAKFASGIYFYQLKATGDQQFTSTMKMLLIK